MFILSFSHVDLCKILFPFLSAKVKGFGLNIFQICWIFFLHLLETKHVFVSVSLSFSFMCNNVSFCTNFSFMCISAFSIFFCSCLFSFLSPYFNYFYLLTSYQFSLKQKYILRIRHTPRLEINDFVNPFL